MDILSRTRIEELKTNGYNFDIGDYISKGINIFKKDAGLFIGYTLIVGLIYFVVSLLGGLIQFVGSSSIALIAFSQIFQSFVPQIIYPPLVAGFLIASHKMYNNEQTEFGDFFKGFEYYAQLVIQAFIIIGISLAMMVPIGILAFMMAGMSIGGVEDFGAPQIAILVLVSLVVFVGYIYLMVSYLFANAFVVFGNMSAWEALETSRLVVAKNFWSVFGFGLIIGIIYIIGLMFCYIGLLVTIPVAQASIYAAFRDMMGFDNPDVFNQDGDILDHLVD